MGNKKYTGLDNQKRVAWLRMRAQAKSRGELFELTWEEFKSLWTDALWFYRGSGSEDLGMTRKDRTLSWSINNVIIVERRIHLADSAKRTRTGYKKGEKQNELN
jgi:hypothetical protein